MAVKFLRFCGLTLTVLWLAGCAPAPEPDPDEPEVTEAPAPDEPEMRTPAILLAEARQARTTVEQQLLLLEASRWYLDHEQPHAAGAILSQLPRLTLSPGMQPHWRLQVGELYLQLADYAQARHHLADLGDQLTRREQRVQAWTLHARALVAKEDYLAAAFELMQASRYDQSRDYHREIWAALQQVPAATWRQPPTANRELEQGWVQLLVQLTQALDRNLPVAEALQIWQRNFPVHPASNVVDDLLAQPRVAEPPTQIAVLLPLSGPLADESEALRAGMLGYLSNQETTVEVSFLDTHEQDAADLAAALRELDPELVIGPLNRTLFRELSTARAAEDWWQLWLNRPDQATTTEQDIFFALDQSAETRAAADWLADQNHEHLLLLGADTSRYRQFSRQLEDRWSQLQPGGRAVTQLAPDADTVGDAVADAMGVAASEARKDAIEDELDQEVHYELRSRQDTDAIYLLGDADQARMLMPFVELNFSGFGRRAPRFASSAVHTENTATSSDLAGLTFSEAPWLIPGHPAAPLRAQFQEALGSNWDLQLQRLTAMGYDSAALMTRLPLMNQLPGYHFAGLTGQLRIEQQELVRRLDWATFTGQSIQSEYRLDVDQSAR